MRSLRLALPNRGHRSLKPDGRVRPVAERLVGRAPATAQDRRCRRRRSRERRRGRRLDGPRHLIGPVVGDLNPHVAHTALAWSEVFSKVRSRRAPSTMPLLFPNCGLREGCPRRPVIPVIGRRDVAPGRGAATHGRPRPFHPLRSQSPAGARAGPRAWPRIMRMYRQNVERRLGRRDTVREARALVRGTHPLVSVLVP